MHFVELVGLFAESNQHSHSCRQLGPRLGFEGERILLWVAHLVLQGDTTDSMKGQSP